MPRGEVMEPALDIPEQIGSYLIRKKIGEGGMGAVYLAEHALLGRRAAVKVLHKKYTAQETHVERFFNEARAATSIADPGIVQIFDFGYHDDTAYIVMEFLDGESLDARLQRLGRIPVADVLRLARQLALSLYAAHQRGVIHRDLKPENIFIVADPEVVGGERTKILDFGIAKLVDNDQSRVRTQTGLMMGTPLYMSPEQCRGAGAVDHRADIYSLGCVIFHVLTGRLPFDAEGAGELIASHLREPAPAPSTVVPVSAVVDGLVLRCMAKSAGDRYETMRDLALELDKALKTTTLPPSEQDRLTPIPGALKSSSAATVAHTPRRRRWLLPLIGAVAVAGGVAAVLVMSKNSSSSSAPTAPTQPAVAPPSAPPQPAPTPPPPPPPAPPPEHVASPPADVGSASGSGEPPAIAKPQPKPHPGKPHPKPAPTIITRPGTGAGSGKPPVDPYADR